MTGAGERLGVPTHALRGHAVVVLLPLAALTWTAVALVPVLRRRYGGLVLPLASPSPRWR